jgi:hypothetical protein
MAEIPQCYVKDKPVDYEREILAILGEGVRVDSWHFLPPSLGVWSLWEILDSPIIHGSEDATQGDYLRLLWVNAVRRDAVEHVALWTEVGKPKPGECEVCELDDEVVKWAESFLPPEALSEAVRDEVLAQLPLCYTGYERIPSTGGNTGPWLFAGEAYGAICGSSTADYDTLIWDTPMALHGHVTAHMAASNGAKDIARPKDEEHIKEMLAETNEREKRGELHPWQIEDPRGVIGTNLGLSAEQCKHPECVDRFEQLLANAKDK